MAQRLVRLEPRVDAEALVARVLSNERSRRRARQRPRFAFVAVAVTLLMILSTVGASYYAPVFAQAVADAPIAGSITGWMLRAVGLAGVPHRVTMIGDAVTSSGYRVDLVGGYADAGRTVMFLRVSPGARVVLVPTQFAQELTLHDQFGQTYRQSAAIQNSLTGENSLIFEALRWPASIVGARLWLSFSTLEVGVPPSSSLITGHWQLAGTLAKDEGRNLTLPADGTVGEMRVAFTRVRAMPSALLVDFDLQPGGLDLNRVIPDGLKGRRAFTVTLVGDVGDERLLLQGQFGSRGTGNVAGTWIWLVDRPGHYQLRISYEGVGSLTREIDVP